MHLTAFLIACVISSFSVTVALADPPQGHKDRPDRGESRSGRGNSSDAAKRAQQMNGGGRVLSVDAVAGGHRVKLLKDGEVRIVFVPD
jgi:hypothetical protein